MHDEWKKEIPSSFQGVNLQLTNEVEARLIHLRMSDANKESSAWVMPELGVAASASMALPEVPSTFVYIDIEKLIEFLMKNASVPVN